MYVQRRAHAPSLFLNKNTLKPSNSCFPHMRKEKKPTDVDQNMKESQELLGFKVFLFKNKEGACALC